MSGTVRVTNKNGIHLRLAGEIVKAAGKFKSTVMIGKDGDETNAKSILGVAGLGAEYGTQLTLRITGSDEEKAMESLIRLFESNFSEGEGL